MTWHLMRTRRADHEAVRDLLAWSRDEIDRLLRARLISDTAIEIAVAKVVQQLVDVERYLHDTSVDWRNLP